WGQHGSLSGPAGRCRTFLFGYRICIGSGHKSFYFYLIITRG
ncbi:MAG: hypothetical protein AVDCRST_MAG56-7603, partial [uncultured Cytophagales bacterium]